MLFYMLGAHWRGEYSLPRAFWVNALGALLMTQTLIQSVPLLLAYILQKEVWQVGDSNWAALLKLILPACALIWAAVGGKLRARYSQSGAMADVGAHRGAVRRRRGGGLSVFPRRAGVAVDLCDFPPKALSALRLSGGSGARR